MAGVKGRSGGARPGAGRPKRATQPVEPDTDAVEFLTKVMQGLIEPSTAQLDAAKTLVRAAAEGKKAQKQKAAEGAAGGKFSAAAPPLKLVRRA